jgi:hypothetical protein
MGSKLTHLESFSFSAAREEAWRLPLQEQAADRTSKPSAAPSLSRPSLAEAIFPSLPSLHLPQLAFRDNTPKKGKKPSAAATKAAAKAKKKSLPKGGKNLSKAQDVFPDDIEDDDGDYAERGDEFEEYDEAAFDRPMPTQPLPSIYEKCLDQLHKLRAKVSGSLTAFSQA